jgi:hypothetical protein
MEKGEKTEKTKSIVARKCGLEKSEVVIISIFAMAIKL